MRRRTRARLKAVGVTALLVGGGVGLFVASGDEELPAPSPNTRPPAPGRGPVEVVVAGDIGAGTEGARATTRLVADIAPDRVLTTGDNAYPKGSREDFARRYAPTWGRFRAITHPSPGNHDHDTPGASGYFEYFGAAAGPPGRGYYSLDLGAWHLVSLSSEVAQSDRADDQVRWLERDLRRSRARCTLAFWHHPRFTRGNYDDFEELAPIWRALYRYRAEAAFTGHDHNYQRYPAMDPSGQPDRERGVHEFVVGTGGARAYPLRDDPRRVTERTGIFGVLVLRLHPRRMDFEFVPTVRGGYRDAGTIRCR